MTNVEEQIEHDWPPGSPVARACLDIWLRLRAKEVQLDHYTYGQLEALTRVADQTCLTRALLYLATPSLGVLKPSLLYEFEGRVMELPATEFAHFAAGEHVIHPYLGEPLDDDQVFLAFEPGERLAREANR